MKRRKHKRRLNHVLILTSDAADANVKQFRVRAWIVEVVVLLLCVLVGGVIGYFVYEGQLWENASRRSHEQVMALEEENKTLSEQNSKLEEQVTEQAEEIQILSDTVSQKVQSESELSATLEKQSLPTEFPLTGSASMEEVSEGDPMCIFHASVGTTVVAAASGTVIAINDDEIYGHSVWVDHGNGYVTIYRNKGDTTVNVGSVVRELPCLSSAKITRIWDTRCRKTEAILILWICWQSVVDCRKVWKIHVRKKECRYKNEHTDRCRSGVDRRFYIGRFRKN